MDYASGDTNVLDTWLSALWSNYCAVNPQAEKIHQHFHTLGETLINDHMALRTLSFASCNIDHFEPEILSLGYRLIDDYQFPEKKLTARAYRSSDASKPRIFISQLELKECPTELCNAFQIIFDEIKEPLSLSCFTKGRLWSLPSVALYESICAKSEYAAWFLTMGFCANHFTLSVNALKNADLNWVNEQIKQLGYELNSHGGEIKGSEELLLEQSSTLASRVQMTFSDVKDYSVPGCYYEFAKRYVDKSGELYQGFVTVSADKIFQSTDHSHSS